MPKLKCVSFSPTNQFMQILCAVYWVYVWSKRAHNRDFFCGLEFSYVSTRRVMIDFSELLYED